VKKPSRTQSTDDTPSPLTLKRKFSEWLADVACYVRLVIWRAAFGAEIELGESYRQRIESPGLLSYLDQWAREVAVHVEQADDPPPHDAIIDAFVAAVRTELPPQEQQDFMAALEREQYSPQFLAEVDRLRNSPQFLALSVVFAKVHGAAPSAKAGTEIQQFLLGRLGAKTAQEEWHDERKQPLLDQTVGRVEFVPPALDAMSEEVAAVQIAEETWPWKLHPAVVQAMSSPLLSDLPLGFRGIFAEAFKRAEEKRAWREERWEEKRNRAQDPDTLSPADRPTSEVVQFPDTEKTALTRTRLAKRFAEIEKDIRRTYRKQRARHYLRLWRLYCESGGDLPQTEATARRVECSLSTVKRFFADARRRGWIPD
jgi:hypothetical protein